MRLRWPSRSAQLMRWPRRPSTPGAVCPLPHPPGTGHRRAGLQAWERRELFQAGRQAARQAYGQAVARMAFDFKAGHVSPAIKAR